jgi:hypothetical protein
VPIKDFGVSTPIGKVMGPNSDIGRKYSRLNCFHPKSYVSANKQCSCVSEQAHHYYWRAPLIF